MTIKRINDCKNIRSPNAIRFSKHLTFADKTPRKIGFRLLLFEKTEKFMTHFSLKITALTVFCCLFISFSDKKPPPQYPLPVTYPQGYFQSPVGGGLSLSGSFGELRANHFHSGIDIKPTHGRGNQEPIFAAADGYVVRIRTQAGGYGQALYIAHPNGFTTLYGHLSAFSPEITDFLRKKQTELESFEVDLALQPNEIAVQAGQQIANMGNRGHSFGEHLHFEIRETATDRAVNPLLFGLPIADNVPPTMNGLKVYLLDDKREVVGERYVNLVKKSLTEYRLSGDDTLDIAAPNVAFALKTTDRHNGDSGENGIFSLELTADDALIYRFRAESFGFDETRYINAHLDYFEQQYRRAFFHRAFTLAGDHLSMNQNVVNQGTISLNLPPQYTQSGQDSLEKKITLTVSDAAGNVTTLRFYVKPKQPFVVAQPKIYNYLLPFDAPSLVKMDDDAARFYFPNNSFYENIYARFQRSNVDAGNPDNIGKGGVFSPTFHFHEPLTPVQEAFAVSIRPQNLPDSLRDKAFIAYCQRDDGRTYTCGGKWDAEGFLKTASNRFGNYSIQIDRTPPTITVINFSEKMYRQSRLAFRLHDNHETMGNARPLRYRAELDGKWFLMELDGKSDLLYRSLENAEITEGVEHSLKISLTDDRDNTAVFEGKFRLTDEPPPRPRAAKSSKKHKRH